MTSTLKIHKTLIIFTLLFFAWIWSFESVLWGFDGFSLWMPIISEYLKGTYENSVVIFGGQNLLSTYGCLPFWILLKWFKASPIQVMNVTFFILVMSFYILMKEITKGLTKKTDKFTNAIIFIYCLLSPVFLNRVYAGHFNLLFGIQPLLISIGLIYNRSKSFSFFCIFLLTCSFSTPSYQIIAYNLFYIPLLYLWIMSEYNKIPLWYAKKIILLVFVSIVLSYPSLSAMIAGASSQDNIRNDATQIVFSYITSIPQDFLSLIMSSLNSFTTRDNFFLFFHEINYPIGLTFLAVFFLRGQQRKILICLLLTMGILFALSANVPLINLMAKIPLINLFRVPQRSLMTPSYLVPLFFLLLFKDRFNLKTLFFLLAFILLGNGIPNFELVCSLLAAVILILKKSEKYPELYFSIVFSTLFFSLPVKYVMIRDGNTAFENNLQRVAELDKQYELAIRKTPIQFLDQNAFHLITAANYLGIPTPEGYGHPPKRNFLKVKKHLPIKIDPMTNIFSISEYYNHPKYLNIIKDLGIKRVYLNSSSGKFQQKIIND